MASGIDLYSQSMDKDKRAAGERGSLMDLLSIISMGSGFAAKAAAKGAASSALKSTATEAAKQGAEGAAKAAAGNLSVSAYSNAAKTGMISAAAKQEGLSTLVNNIIPQPGSGIKPMPQGFQPPQLSPVGVGQSHGSFLGGLQKGVLGQPQGYGINPQTGMLEFQGGADTSPWFYAGAAIPSILRNKLGLDTTMEAGQRQTTSGYYRSAMSTASGTQPGNNPFLSKIKGMLKIGQPGGYNPSSNSKVFYDTDTGTLSYE